MKTITIQMPSSMNDQEWAKLVTAIEAVLYISPVETDIEVDDSELDDHEVTKLLNDFAFSRASAPIWASSDDDSDAVTASG